MCVRGGGGDGRAGGWQDHTHRTTHILDHLPLGPPVGRAVPTTQVEGLLPVKEHGRPLVLSLAEWWWWRGGDLCRGAGASCTHHGEATARGDGGDLDSQHSDDAPAIGGQANDDARGTNAAKHPHLD